MRDYAMASVTAAILALFATRCDDVAPETVVRAEPAEAASIDSGMGPPPPTQAEGNAVAQEEATVTFVIDGDTVDVALADEVAERVRHLRSTLPKRTNADTRSRRRSCRRS